MSYTLSATAYFKLFFHAAKHPHKPVNGVLLGKKSDGEVIIEDAVPLLHHWTSLSPMMEIGLDLVCTCLPFSYYTDHALFAEGRSICGLSGLKAGRLLSGQ